jgi:hypothetical protein
VKSRLGGFLPALLTAILCAAGAHKAPDEKLAPPESECPKLQSELERAQAQWEKTDARFAQVDWTISHDLVVQRRLAGGNRFDGKRVIDVDLEHEEAARFGPHDKFTFSAWIRPKELTGAILTRGEDVVEGDGYRLYLKDGKVQVHLVKSWRRDALRVEAKRAIDPDQWHNVTVTYDGQGAAGGIKIYVDGQPQKLKINSNNLHSSFESREPLRIGGGGGPDNRFRGQIRSVRIFRAALTPDEVAVLATDTPVSALVGTPPEKRTAAESRKVRLYFLERNAPAGLREAWQRVCELRNQ